MCFFFSEIRKLEIFTTSCIKLKVCMNFFRRSIFNGVKFPLRDIRGKFYKYAEIIFLSTSFL